MAFDDFLLRKVEKERGLTFVRFYRWKNPTVSIGRRQKARDVINFDKLRQFGASFVRRPTGGKAVLHYEELTYSVSSSSNEFNKVPSVRYAYNRIARALLDGLKNLGVKAEIVSKDPKGIVKSDLPCFSYPTRDEITVNGKKIIGSAQKRVKDAFLQHGSIPVKDHRKMYAEITGIDYHLLENTMTTIELEIKREVSFQELVSAFREGFLKTFSIDLLNYELTFDELNEVKKIEREIYSQDKWNYEF